jgi:hypothetical protein
MCHITAGRLLAGLGRATVAGATLLSSACARPGAPAVRESPAGTVATEDSARWMDGYYLSDCAWCGGLLGAKGDAVEVSRGGRSLRFCSGPCAADFDAAGAAAFNRLDARMIADQRPHYPLNVSLLTGRPLGPARVEFVWGNRLFVAADEAERQRILGAPADAIRALDRAVVAAQTPGYGMPTKCPVQGDILPSDEVLDIVVANRMIRVCCVRCARTVRARPYQYLAMVEYANRAAAEPRRSRPPSDR